MSHFAFNDPDPGKRLDALEAFVEHWMGPRLPEYGATPDQLDHLQLPVPLRRLYAFCFNWPREHGLPGGIPLLSIQNQMLLTQSTSEPQPGVPPGLLCFASENQGVTRWVTCFDGDDPPVYGLDYEEDEFYKSADGEVHERWFKIADSLTDFLVGFTLYELALANCIWQLTPLTELFQSQPDLLKPLVSHVHGYPREIYLYGDDLLVTRVPQWNKPPTWEMSPQDSKALAKLSQFEGTVVCAGFSLVEDDMPDTEPRKWHVSFNRDGSGGLASARSPRYLSRDSFPVGTLSIDSIVAQIEADGQTEPADEHQTAVTVKREFLQPVSGPTHYLPASVIANLFRLAIDAIPDPSLELLEQLELGSPLE